MPYVLFKWPSIEPCAFVFVLFLRRPVLWQTTKTPIEQEKERTIMSALAFPICILLAPPSQRRLNTDIQSQSTRDIIRNRLWRWLLGESAALWNTFRKIADPTRVATSIETPEEVKKRITVKLTQEYRYIKAISTLSDVHEPSKQVLEALKMKHPLLWQATDAEFPIVSSAPIVPAHKLLTEAGLMQEFSQRIE